MQSLILESKEPLEASRQSPPKRLKITANAIVRKIFALWVILATIVWSFGGVEVFFQKQTPFSPKTI